MANTAGNLGTTWGWGLGENNWKAAHDKNLRAFDALVQCHIIERVLTTPPATPADGDCYIPATGATGAWAGHANEIARWNASASQWEFWVPRKGWEVFNESDNYAYRWSGTAWAGCNFSFAQLDQNYIKRSGETQQINTTGGYAVSGSEVISAGKVGWFTGLNSSGGGTISGGKLTLAPAAAGYASLNIPTRSAAVSSPVAGDIENTGSDILLYGLGFRADNFINARATVAGGQNSGYIIKSAGGIDRWAIYKDASTESGSDAGSGLIIRAYDDAGGVIGTVASCGRAAGTAFVIGRPLTAQSSITASSFVKSAGRQSAFIARTTAYTALATDEVIGISGTTIFNVLLPATAVVGTCYTIKRTDANTTAHTVTAGGTTTIDGATTFTFSTAWQVLRVIATATNAYSVI